MMFGKIQVNSKVIYAWNALRIFPSESLTPEERYQCDVTRYDELAEQRWTFNIMHDPKDGAPALLTKIMGAVSLCERGVEF